MVRASAQGAPLSVDPVDPVSNAVQERPRAVDSSASALKSVMAREAANWNVRHSAVDAVCVAVRADLRPLLRTSKLP
ncbi:MAG TPA: hypothetical protein PKH32_10945, partial [Verrucomicrobiota bacterium]|nr:hypothetical protein [Verrucomicrobiota bacterium]